MKVKLRDWLIRGARLAGRVHRDVLMNGHLETVNKTANPGDVVTLADKKSEEVLRVFWRRRLSKYNVFGEEYGASYNGNGKVIVIDPLDCTLCFSKSTPEEIYPGFGPIIGVYKNGKNVGGVMYNVMRDVMYVATEKTGFERIGTDEPIAKNVIVIINHHPEYADFIAEIVELVRDEFPENPVLSLSPDAPDIAENQNVLAQGRVCDGTWTAYFNAGTSWHDMSPAPLFGKLTGTCATDHNGIPYDTFNPEEEFKKYQAGHDAIYSKPLLIAKPEYHKRMLRILEKFKDRLPKGTILNQQSFRY